MHKDQKADEFLTEFKNLAVRTGYDEEALIDMLQRALIEVPSLLEKVLQLRVFPEEEKAKGKKKIPGLYRPETLEEWYTTVGDFDRAWHQSHEQTKNMKAQESHRTRKRPAPCQQEYAPPAGPPPGYRQPAPAPRRGPAGSFAPQPRRPNQWANQPHGQVNSNRPANNNNGYIPTRRDATGITYGGLGQPMNIGRVDLSKVDCHFCGKKGHMQRECRTRLREGAPMVQAPAPLRTRCAESTPAQTSGAGQGGNGITALGMEYLNRAFEIACTMGTPPAQTQTQGFRRSRR